MKTIKANMNFTLNSKSYFKGDEIESKELKIEEIVSLNEKGFIQPLTHKDIISLIKERENKKSLNKPIKIKEGE